MHPSFSLLHVSRMLLCLEVIWRNFKLCSPEHLPYFVLLWWASLAYNQAVPMAAQQGRDVVTALVTNCFFFKYFAPSLESVLVHCPVFLEWNWIHGIWRGNAISSLVQYPHNTITPPPYLTFGIKDSASIFSFFCGTNVPSFWDRCKLFLFSQACVSLATLRSGFFSAICLEGHLHFFSANVKSGVL